MKTTASLLTFSIALALATAAQAGLQDPPRDQDTTTQALDERQPPTTDPLDTMDEPLEAANPMQTVTDPLTAQTSDSSTMDQLDTSAGLDPADDMDEPSYDATAAAQQPDQADRPAAAAELGEFANHDPDGDGYIGRDEIPADDAGLLDAFARFDANADERLDRYEFESLAQGRFASLDANADQFVDSSEASSFAALGSSFASVDVDGDGRVSEVEYRSFLDSGAWASDRERYAFRYMDTNGDGFVSRTEAAQFTDFAAEFDALDEDADGLVDSSQYDGFMDDWDEDTMAYEPDDDQ